MVGRRAAGRSDALAPDADDLAVRQAPLLARAAITLDEDNPRTVGRGAPLDVQTAARGPRDMAALDRPMLAGHAVAVKEDSRCPVRIAAALRTHTRTATADDLRPCWRRPVRLRRRTIISRRGTRVDRADTQDKRGRDPPMGNDITRVTRPRI